MSSVVYLNGAWVPIDEARVSVEDRGFMFADGVYEVVRYFGGRGLALAEHRERLDMSLQDIRIALPEDQTSLEAISDEIVRRNNLPDAVVYWQITRGVAPRKHAFPPANTRPTVLVMAYPAGPLDARAPVRTAGAVTHPDQRWQLNRIKSIALLPAVLSAQAAADAGCRFAILVRDGIITEGSSSSILIDEGDALRIHPLDGRVLDSITRRIAIELCAESGKKVLEEAVPINRLFQAREVIALGTTTEVTAVTHIDGTPIGGGAAGPVATDLYERFKKHVIEQCALG